jgi:hypothetical protein
MNTILLLPLAVGFLAIAVGFRKKLPDWAVLVILFMAVLNFTAWKRL